MRKFQNLFPKNCWNYLKLNQFAIAVVALCVPILVNFSANEKNLRKYFRGLTRTSIPKMSVVFFLLWWSKGKIFQFYYPFVAQFSPVPKPIDCFPFRWHFHSIFWIVKMRTRMVCWSTIKWFMIKIQSCDLQKNCILSTPVSMFHLFVTLWDWIGSKMTCNYVIETVTINFFRITRLFRCIISWSWEFSVAMKTFHCQSENFYVFLIFGVEFKGNRCSEAGDGVDRLVNLFRSDLK